MDVWGWVLVYVVGLTVLQLLVYRYLLRDGGSLTQHLGTPSGDNDHEAPWSQGSTGPNRSVGGPADSDAEPDDAPPAMDAWPEDDAYVPPGPTRPDTTNGRRCPHCGAENETDEAFTHCWNCTRAL
jgi:hypothetical protein